MSHVDSGLGLYFHSYGIGSINMHQEQVYSKNVLVVFGSNVKYDSAVGFPNTEPWMGYCGTGSFQVNQRSSVLNPMCVPACVCAMSRTFCPVV